MSYERENTEHFESRRHSDGAERVAATAVALVAPHENHWVEDALETANVRSVCPQGAEEKFFKDEWGCFELSNATRDGSLPNDFWAGLREDTAPKRCRASRLHSCDWDGWMIYGPITLGLFAGLYAMTGSLSLRPLRPKRLNNEMDSTGRLALCGQCLCQCGLARCSRESSEIFMARSLHISSPGFLQMKGGMWQ